MNTDHELTGNAMTFSSPMDAKNFLAGKIAAEAENRGMHLSEGEQKLLLFSEQDPESPVDIPEELLEGVDEEYERKITSHARRRPARQAGQKCFAQEPAKSLPGPQPLI
jgi:hypothetical protein